MIDKSLSGVNVKLPAEEKLPQSTQKVHRKYTYVYLSAVNPDMSDMKLMFFSLWTGLGSHVTLM